MPRYRCVCLTSAWPSSCSGATSQSFSPARCGRLPRLSADVGTFAFPEDGLSGVCLFDDREFSRSPTCAHTTATPFSVSAGRTLRAPV